MTSGLYKKTATRGSASWLCDLPYRVGFFGGRPRRGASDRGPVERSVEVRRLGRMVEDAPRVPVLDSERGELLTGLRVPVLGRR